MSFTNASQNLLVAAASSATRTLVFESLEGRQLFANSAVQPLPFVLEFEAPLGDVLDKDGQGTGFTRVQANKLGTQYNASLIDLDTTTGTLVLTTSGTAAAGGPYNGDNTLVNGLETQFDATTSGFAVTTRLKGPLSFIDNPSEQAGIMFGPDQDNYVKLVAVSQRDASGTPRQYIQFIDEQTTDGVYTHALAGSNVSNTLTSIGSFASVNTLDLRLVGDAATRKVTAFYAVNGGAFVKISAELTLSTTKAPAFFAAAGRAGLIAMHKNDLGPMTAEFERFEITPGTAAAAQPSIAASDPANGQIDVARDASIRNSVYLPTSGAGVDESTLNGNTVRLFRTRDGALVAGDTDTSGGGDTITFAPGVLLDANTNYTFVIDGVKDTSGALFVPYQITFTTGSQFTAVNKNFAFEKVTLNTASGKQYSAVKMGPDGRLYAATLDGLIQRFAVNADGTLGAAEDITSLQAAEGGQRFLTGIAFDPASTAANPILWVTHSFYALTNAQDWSGKISKLSGTNLATVTHVVRNLPRSIRDHTTNQLAFSPADGKLYFTQGSQSAMGAPDNTWGLRPEHLLSGAVLRLDPSKIPAGTTLDAKTEDGGTYNPFATGAPLTIYGRGVRNAYDLLFHGNGHLYVPTNGSAPGGNTPAGGGAPGLTDVREVMNDYLFDVVQGGYYGHPNPKLGHYVLNGGNPTSGVDAGEVTSYPVGTAADPNYKGFAYDFGENQSPNGVIEYRSGGSAFGGALDGKILVVQYSIGNDVVALTPGAGGAITGVDVNIPGLTTFNDPLDIEVNAANGFVYVVEHGGLKITLARPITPGANAEVDKPKLVFNDPTNTTGGQTQQISVKNTGTGPLTFDTDAFTITGATTRFSITDKPTLPLTLQPGESTTVSVTFSASAVSVFTGTLVVKTNDPDSPTINVPLRGLGTTGTGGSNEPSLQRILDLHQLPIRVGDADPLTTQLQSPLTTPNDELVMPRLQAAGEGPVTIEPLAVFGVGHSTLPTLRFGYYTPGNATDRTELFTVRGATSSQTVAPTVTGDLSFDPGTEAFGLYGLWPSMSTISSAYPNGTETYSEDGLNTAFDPSSPRKFRFYALKDANGVAVPNAYVVAVEEFTGGNYDNQDVVFIIRNVKAAAPGPEIGYENLDGAPYNDRMLFNRITIPDPEDPNYVKDTGKLRIRNTGSSSLTINGLTLSNPNWELVGAPAAPFTVGANGGFVDVTIRFKATSGTIHNGTLTIGSNDADEPSTVIELAGWRQNRSENNEEPDLAQQFQLLGYTSQVTKPGQTLNNGGRVEAVGDEVLSPYWKRADAGKSITVRQLSAYHTQGNVAAVRYHTKSNTGTTTLFTHNNLDGQTFFPRISGSLAPAVGSFSHSGTFGFRVDNEWSDPALNTSGDGGHHVRFYVVKDRAGEVIPDTYLMVMDYAAINYDYQDNVYLVSNIKPELGPAAPTAVTATSAAGGVALDWADNAEVNLGGYNVYRSDAADGTYAKLNGAPLTRSDFVDAGAAVNVESFYRVVAVDTNGTESAYVQLSVTRVADATPPAAPGGLIALGALDGITLDWGNNVDADLAGYHVERSSALNGTYTRLNSVLLSSSDFVDVTAPTDVTVYYRVTAVDVDGNASSPAVTSAVRPSDTSAPGTPVNVVAVGEATGIGIDWTDNTESDLAGYRVYRSDAPNGAFTLLTGVPLSDSEYLDTEAPNGVRSYYRVTAVNTSGAESLFAAANATRVDTVPPGAPAVVGATASPSGITLGWAANTEADLAGYNVYRSNAADGVYVKLNAGLVLVDSYVDANAPAGVTSFYRVTAVDERGNESAPSQAAAFRPVIGANGNANDVAYDASGTLHFVYYDAVEKTLKYATRAAAGTWSPIQVIDRSGADVGMYLSMALTSMGKPAVAYFDATGGDLKYAALSGATWAVQTVDAPQSVGLYPSLKFDRNDQPAIAYYRRSSGDLRLARRDGAGWIIRGVATVDDVGRFASLAMQGNGLWAIAYENTTAGTLQYVYETSGSQWQAMTVDHGPAGFAYLSLAFDQYGRASMSYQESSMGDLKYAVLKSGKWAKGTVAWRGSVGQHSKLVFGANGMANIFFYNRQLDTLVRAEGYLGNWAGTTLETGGGRYVSAALGTPNKITYSWLDRGTQVLQPRDLVSFR